MCINNIEIIVNMHSIEILSTVVEAERGTWQWLVVDMFTIESIVHG